MNDEKNSTPLTFEQAQQVILSGAVAGTGTVELPIVDAQGQVLAERITSPIDMPAFDKSAMDGFAFRYADLVEHADKTAQNTFRVVTTIAAGQAPGTVIGPGECARIMTGAPLPEQADTVIPVEDTSLLNTDSPDGPDVWAAAGPGEEWVRFHSLPTAGRHVAPQGEDVREGDLVFEPGTLLNHQEIAVLATVGRPGVSVYAGPSVAFAATGEELIEPGNPLAPGQIYNANAYCLWSQIMAAHGRPHYLGVIRDDEDDLRNKIATGLEHDLLILSGGVSMGKFDYVPQILQELGVELHMRKLLVKPGRPTIFGTRNRTQVFGLPGNPISTLYAFDQYVTPSIRLFRHHPRPESVTYQGELTRTVRKKSGRMMIQPCIRQWTDQGYMLEPLKTHGSADIFAIAGADALALIPADVSEMAKGETVCFRKLYE